MGVAADEKLFEEMKEPVKKSKIRRFHRKPHEFMIIKYTGDNTEEIQEALGMPIFSKDNGVLVITTPSKRELWAAKDNWIVTDLTKGEMYVADDSYINHRFEENNNFEEVKEEN